MSTEKLSLIYLDDEEINLILFKEMFKKDFDIYTTTSPHKAIDHVVHNDIDFILTDQLMPDMTGVEFLRELEEIEFSATPKKIIISGYTKEGEVSEAIEKKLIDKFVSKPWSYDKLRDLLLTI
ncbi:MAG: response regulator [Bacteroidota bacterium]